MNRIRPFAVLFLLLGLAACTAAPSVYQPEDNGVGYSQQQIDGSTWRVQFTGNESTSRARVEDYLLYRAAEVMRFGGYDRFLLLEKTIEPDVSYWGAGYGPSLGLGVGRHHRYGGIDYGPAHYLPQTRYRGSALIRVYVPGQVGGPIFSAAALIEQIGPRIAWPQQN